MSKKCTLLRREAHVEVKMLKAPKARTTFGLSDVVSRGRRTGLCILSWGSCSISKNDSRRGTFDEDLQRCIFRGRRSSLDRWGRKIAKRIGTRLSALHSTFHFWRTSRRIASSLMLSTLKIEDVSQNCVVFNIVKCNNWGSLAELQRFWCCQAPKPRKSRRIASFSSLQIDRQR